MDNSIILHNSRAFPNNGQIDGDDTRNSFVDSFIPSPEFSMTNPSDPDLACVSCNEPCTLRPFIAACKHAYCIGCLTPYVEGSLKPGETFPPQCCRIPFTLRILRDHLPQQTIACYESKQAEIATLSSLLCSEPGCRIIIPEDHIVNDLGNCPGCNRNTYSKCRTTQHDGKECPTDKEREEVMKMVKEKGWQACYHCNNMIELNFGCNHMT